MVAPDIASAANPHVKALAKLKDRRGRDAAGQFLIEGSRELGRAIDAGIDIGEILLSPDLATSAAERLAADTAVTTLAGGPFRKLSVRQNPDGIIGVARTWDPALGAIDRDLVLIADAIEKPGNLGAMLRTADGAGAAVVAADPAVDLFNPNVVRASQGALFTVPVAVADAAVVRSWAEGRGSVFVTRPDAATTIWKADLTGVVALVIGSEHEGAGAAWEDAGTSVAIPMAGAADSLNASVTAAIAVYEAVRQRV